jgi:hypothetical protein
MYFTCRSFIGQLQPGLWSQYWENEPDDPFLTSNLGHLFGLISLNQSNQDGDQLSQIGRQIITQINQSYFSSSDLSAPQKLKTTLEKLTADLDPAISYTLILAVIFNNQLHLAVYHTGSCFLKRGDTISTLISGQSRQNSFISGPIQDDDRIFLVTDSFFQEIGFEKIQFFLSQDKLPTMEEDILSSIYSATSQSDLASAFIHIHRDDESSAPVEELPVGEPSEAPVSLPKTRFSFLKNIFKKKDIYVSHQQIKKIDQRKKINIIIALALLAALTVSAFFGFRKNQSKANQTSFDQISGQIEEKLKNAQAVKNLSLDNAQQLAREASDLLSQIETLGLYPQTLDTYRRDINTLLSQTGSSQDLNVEFVYDASLIGSDPKYSQIIFSSPNLLLVNKEFGRVDSIDVNQKSHKNISLSDDIKSAISIVESSNNYYLLTSAGISLLNKNTIEQKTSFSDSDLSLSPLDLQAWNTALYVLSSNSITKFTPSGSNFSASPWLEAGQNLPASVSSLAINGKLWLLSTDGTITPFVRGQVDSFIPKQIISATSANNLVVGIDSDTIAFTDQEKLIFVFQKTGEFVAKYDLGDKKIHDIALDESNNIIYILCYDQRIYRLSL